MGNCQAAEVASAAVIQHPDGRIERVYWPKAVEEVMKRNPEHHVALVTRFVSQQRNQQESSDGGGYVRVTRVRLLRPADVLLFGQVYRLVDSQEVSKALKARKLDKVRRSQSESSRKQRQQLQSCKIDEESVEFGEGEGEGEGRVESERLVDQQVEKQEGDGQRSTRARQWRPTLQSISESVS